MRKDVSYFAINIVNEKPLKKYNVNIIRSGLSSFGRASDCSGCSYQMVAGSIPAVRNNL